MLLNLVLPVEPVWDAMRPDLKLLNRFAVEYRYPGLLALRQDAEEALQECEGVRRTVRASFGLPA